MHAEMEVVAARFRSRILRITLATVAFDLAMAFVVLRTEDGARHAFETYWDALFWTTTQLLTVSSQFPNPERSLTKVVDVVLELWAIVIVTSLAATFTDVLHHRTRRRLHERGIRPPPT